MPNTVSKGASVRPRTFSLMFPLPPPYKGDPQHWSAKYENLFSYAGETLNRLADCLLDLLFRISLARQGNNSRWLPAELPIVQPSHNRNPYDPTIVLNAGGAEAIQPPRTGLTLVGPFGVERPHGDEIVATSRSLFCPEFSDQSVSKCQRGRCKRDGLSSK